MNRTWTQEMEDQVYLLNKQNISMSEIANMINNSFGTNLTKNSIVSKINRLRKNNKITTSLRQDETVIEYSRRAGNRKWSERAKERLIELNEEGFRTVQIVKKLNGEFDYNFTSSSVSAMRSNLGLEKPVSISKLNQKPSKKPVPIKIEQSFDFTHNLLDLRNSQCHYTDNAVDFCGEQVVGNKSYCKKHLKLCYAGRTETTEQRKGY